MLLIGLSGIKRRSQQIAVVELEGTIGARIKAAEYGKLFRALEENDRVRAVVLDIDSPGGSASASDYLHARLKALASKKPVVAYIRGTGASGAYLISCAAAKIVAIPSAIVGSIGVISLHPLLYDAMSRVGLKVSVTKSDRLKDMGSMFREPTEEEHQKEQALVDELYDQFIDAVAAGRGMDRESVKALATGEIFTGRRGKELGLIDELGDIERAIDIAAELSEAPRRPVWVRPRRGLRDMVSSLVAGAFVNEIVSQVEERFRSGVFYQHRL